MDERLLSLAAGTVLDVDAVQAVDVAAAAGWPAVGLWFDADRWQPGTSADIRRRLDADGLVALDIEPIILTPADPTRTGPLVTDAAKRLVAAGGEIGARNVLVASRDPDAARVTAAVHQLCVLADPFGMRVVLEFLPIMAVRTLADAVAIVSAADHPAAGVLVDVLHLLRSGGTPAEVARVSRHLLPYAQFCDVAADTPRDTAGLVDEALHGRLLPGDGVAPLHALLAALPAGCPLSLEMRSGALVAGHPDPVDRARVVLGAIQRVLSVAP